MKGFELVEQLRKEAVASGGILGSDVKVLTEEGLVFNVIGVEAERAQTPNGKHMMWLKVEEEDLDGQASSD